MTLLITGASGYLGSHLVNHFAPTHNIIAITRAGSDTSRLGRHKNVHLRTLARNDPISKAVEGETVQAVLHTATNYGRHGETKDEIWRTNVTYASNTLAWATKAGVQVFINADTVLDPRVSEYAASKAAFLEQSEVLCHQSEIQFINVRLEQFYGPAVDTTNFIGYIANSLLTHSSSIDLTAGEQKRDFVYIDDVVNAYACILENLPGFAKRDSVDVGTGVATHLRGLVEMMKELTGANTALNFGALPYRTHEMMDSQSDSSRLNALGWRCNTSLTEGLRMTLQATERALHMGND